jgi:hypothetical protein
MEKDVRTFVVGAAVGVAVGAAVMQYFARRDDGKRIEHRTPQVITSTSARPPVHLYAQRSLQTPRPPCRPSSSRLAHDRTHIRVPGMALQ